MLYGVVDSISLVEHIKEDLDLCKIQIEFDELHIFYSYNRLQEFVNKTVEYDIRQDMYKGSLITIIANIADTRTVQTLDKVEAIRLIPEDAEVRPGCNFCIEAIQRGSGMYGCIGFLSSYEVNCSDLARWFDCKVMDARAKMFNLRIFIDKRLSEDEQEEALKAKVGKYIKFDLDYNKYGYQTKTIEYESIPVTLPPEVETAVAIINNAIVNDSQLQAYVRDYNFIETMKEIINCELGYNLVIIASEILMIEMLENISNLYDIKLMVRAAITSRGYLLPAKTKFSRPQLNINRVLKSELKTSRDLILLLDPLKEEEPTITERMYMRIASFVNDVIDERRGLNEQKDIIDREQLRSLFGGLL